MKRVLITGIAGFVGSHFIDYLLTEKPEVEIHGTILPKKEQKQFRQSHKIICHQCDLNQKEPIGKLIAEIRPDKIFHLAAQSYVSSSWENPELTLHTNIIGQSNLLEAVRAVR